MAQSVGLLEGDQVFGRSQIQEEIAREFAGVPGLKLKLAGWAARSSPGISKLTWTNLTLVKP